jgi:hypothetical protein
MKFTLKDNILIIRFKSKDKMNEVLDPISNAYEGKITNRQGHNFPASFIPRNHILSKFDCEYVIGIYRSCDLAHEFLHARYYLDSEYRQTIQKEWNEFPQKTKEYLTNFLLRLGYSENVIIDEYQAYRYSESPNFFGIRL